MTRNAREVRRRRRMRIVSLVTSRRKGDPNFFVFSLATGEKLVYSKV
jgi:hypothetical protein